MDVPLEKISDVVQHDGYRPDITGSVRSVGRGSKPGSVPLNQL
jgi:hypothetical protein